MSLRMTLKRAAIFLLVMLLLLVLVGWAWQQRSERADLERFPPAGRMVAVGDQQLHVHCMGEGSPTVLLEAGLGNTTAHWSRVQPGLAAMTRTCSYDRGGLGHSEPGVFPRSGEQIVDELERMLDAAGIEPPLVLVGHSNGALYARLLERRRPGDVQGMVLVDPNPENAPECEELPATARILYGSLVSLADFGAPRLLLPVLFPLGNSLPAKERAEFAALRARGDFLRALWSEWNQACALREAARQAGPPSAGTPVILLSAGVERPDAAVQATELHAEWVASTRGAELRVIDETGHWIQLDRPDTVIAAVQDLLEQRGQGSSSPAVAGER